MSHPSCPECTTPMESRGVRKGMVLWGCSRYPECKRAIMLPEIKDSTILKARKILKSPHVGEVASKRLLKMLEEDPARAIPFVLGKLTPSGRPTVEAVVRERRFKKKGKRRRKVEADPLSGIRTYSDQDCLDQSVVIEVPEAGAEIAPGSEFPYHGCPYETLNPIQTAALPWLGKDCNVVVASSTSSGKTFTAEGFMADALDRGAKAAFLSPLKAVSAEKYDDWTADDHPWSEHRVAIVTGDYQLTEARKRELKRARVIVLTSEMLDSFRGDTPLFVRDSNGLIRRIRLDQAFEDPSRSELEIGTWDNGEWIWRRPSNWIEVGVRNVYRVTLKCGREFVSTLAHNVCVQTPDGGIETRRVKDLVIGEDRVACSSGFETPSETDVLNVIKAMGDSGDHLDYVRLYGPMIDELLTLDTPSLSKVCPLGSKGEPEPVGTSRRRNAWRKRGCLPLGRFSSGTDFSGVNWVGIYHSNKKWPAVMKISEDWAWSLGFYIAEGCLSRNNVNLSQKERGPLERVQSVWGGKIAKRKNGQGRSYYALDISDRLLARVMRGCGEGALNKRIPDYVFGWSKRLIEAVLAGHAAGDGNEVYRDQSKRVHRTHSRQLSADLVDLTLLTGKTARRTRQRADPKTGGWEIVVQDASDDSGLRFDVVMKISPEGRANVYDISVPGTETFLGGIGGVLLHNSRTRRMHVEGNSWLQKILVLVVDESHLLTMEDRGDALEAGLMRFSRQNPHARIVFLSATLPNVDQVGGWLTRLNGKQSVVIVSRWRPTKLVVHWTPYVHHGGWGSYRRNEEEKRDVCRGLVRRYNRDKWLVFVHSKKAGRALLEELGEDGEQAEFHNADLGRDRRRSLEQRFKHGNLRVVIATSTLAWGINMPARRVLVLGVHRGMSEVDPIDVTQMVGRAGRTDWGIEGDAYVLLPDDPMQPAKFHSYVDTYSKIRDVSSVMNEEDTLAFHLCAEVAEGDVSTEGEAVAWHDRSLAAFQGQPIHEGRWEDDKSSTAKGAGDVMDRLARVGCLKKTRDRFEATMLGKVASWLYFSPFDIANWASNFSYLIERDQVYDDDHIAWALGCISTAFKGQYLPREHDQDMTDLTFRLKDKGLTRLRLPPLALAIEGCLTKVRYRFLQGIQMSFQRDSERVLQAIELIDKYVLRGLGSDYVKTLGPKLKYGCSWTEAELCRLPGIGGKKAKILVEEGLDSLKKVKASRKSTLQEILGSKTGLKVWRAAKEMT